MAKSYLCGLVIHPMSDKESINLRIESGLKRAVEQISEEVEGDSRPSDLSQTAANLIKIGLGGERAGIEPDIVGEFFEIPRLFASISFDGEKVTMGTQLDSKTIAELQKEFNPKKHTAAREALQLGVIIVDPGEKSIVGPLGGPRPFAEIDIDDHVEGEGAQEALRYITERLI